MTIAAVILAACMLIFEGGPHFAGAHLDGVLATAWTGIATNGIAYALWFTIVQRLPAATASLGALASPVIGVIGSYFILGEVPTAPDMIGFALIFTASACVLLTRQSAAATVSRAA
jgi:drug/metabolite transporter (DMT)-like permease